MKGSIGIIHLWFPIVIRTGQSCIETPVCILQDHPSQLFHAGFKVKKFNTSIRISGLYKTCGNKQLNLWNILWIEQLSKMHWYRKINLYNSTHWLICTHMDTWKIPFLQEGSFLFYSIFIFSKQTREERKAFKEYLQHHKEVKR